MASNSAAACPVLFTAAYGDFLAVDNVSFTVGLGEILGYLGPNGEDYS